LVDSYSQMNVAAKPFYRSELKKEELNEKNLFKFNQQQDEMMQWSKIFLPEMKSASGIGIEPQERTQILTS
jgi:hypothetical protein